MRTIAIGLLTWLMTAAPTLDPAGQAGGDWTYVSVRPASVGPQSVPLEEAWMSRELGTTWRSLVDLTVVAVTPITRGVPPSLRDFDTVLAGIAPPAGGPPPDALVDAPISEQFTIAVCRNGRMRVWSGPAGAVNAALVEAARRLLADARPATPPVASESSHWIQARPLEGAMRAIVDRDGTAPVLGRAAAQAVRRAQSLPFLWIEVATLPVTVAPGVSLSPASRVVAVRAGSDVFQLIAHSGGAKKQSKT